MDVDNTPLTNQEQHQVDQIISALEQEATHMENVARVFGSYYLGLIAAGVPDDLAGIMLLERSRQLLQLGKEYQVNPDDLH